MIMIKANITKNNTNPATNATTIVLITIKKRKIQSYYVRLHTQTQTHVPVNSSSQI